MGEKAVGHQWIPAFSGLRFIICLMLILHHFDIFNDLNISGWSSIMNVFTEGYLSVSFFFVLSGFVIQYQYGYRPHMSAKEFLFNRVAHLWPTYLLCLFVALFLYAGFSNIVIHLQNSAFWCHFFMLQSWIPIDGLAFSYNGLAWSVSTELFFYIAFVFLTRLNKHYQHIITAGIWAIILLNIIVMKTNSPIAGWIYYINPIFRLADFMLGMCLCDIYRSKKFEPSTVKSATILEIISILFFAWIVIISITSDIGWEWRWQIFYTIPAALLIYAFSFSKGLISKVLGSKLFLFLGKISFPLYLVHQICLAAVKLILGPSLTTWQALLIAGLIATVLAIILSMIIEFFFTEPISRWLRKQWHLHTKCFIGEKQE